AWALGFQVRRTAATQERLLRLAGDLHDARVPCVAIAAPLVALDGEVWDPDAPRRFPDFPDFARRLDAFGLKFVSIVVPGLRRDARSEVYGELSERRFAVATAREREYVGEAAIGECAFPDFTRDEAREWWGDLLEPLAAAGVGGVSNEANEPVVLDGPDRTMPEDNRHAGLGGGEHRRFHNAYGALMARAASDGLTRLRPGRRPFVLTGSSWSGAQRWAAAWTGTGPAEWSRLRTAMTSVLSLGQSGQPFVAVDLGGEEEGAGTPTDELRARWLELATLFPLAISWTLTPMSLEGAGPESAAIRAALARRARLLPLLYTLAEEAHRKGTPIVRPVEWAAPGDRTAAAVEDQFLLGDDVLVAPVDRASATSRSVYVPAGTWYPFDPLAPATATPIEGPTHIRASAPLGTVPMYARGGSVVATAAEPLALEVFPGRGESELYEDAGDGYGFERGECTRRRFTVRTDGVATTLVISPREGTWAPPARRVTVRFHEPDGIRERTFDDDGSAREIRSDLEIAER
ncbi:MAG TPA: TIM-barrel domain-containing protein, partial [Planctomycetota bacterium]|nr:TIM-barrel domain-containing protein [Planctomycetota bacterium]